MHVLIDYQLGNLASIKQSFQKAGIALVLSSDAETIMQADSLILPGVGAFGSAMASLESKGLIEAITLYAKQGKPLLGICLGMQLLFESSEEFGFHKGLGLLKGRVLAIPKDVTVPHMGWNRLMFSKPSHPILQYSDDDDDVYFVHSYYVDGDAKDMIAFTEYGQSIPAIVGNGNIIAMQFHPEKSGAAGARLIRSYKEMMRL